ncbi:hypothetical protein MHU86_25641 [Fragilaria crotonensis]|nr:hypothetical protein MHU86_25641 [Fragilaria crotonensis]
MPKSEALRPKREGMARTAIVSSDLVIGCLLAILLVAGIAMLAVLIAVPRPTGETSPATLPSSTPALTSSPVTPSPTAMPTSFSTPEEIACEFIGHPSLTECRSILKFDSYGSNEVVNGTSIPSEIGL